MNEDAPHVMKTSFPCERKGRIWQGHNEFGIVLPPLPKESKPPEAAGQEPADLETAEGKIGLPRN
ncbi:MAG: hypothetical protein Q7R88_02865 [bacterium]|nr:hypothetical protein [bacterium]